MEKERVKISANLNAETVERLKTLAYEKGSTMTDIINRAVEMEAFLRKVKKDGGKILIENPDGKMQQIIRD